MSQDISKLDRNFALEAAMAEDGLIYRNAARTPFDLRGLLVEEEGFVRIPGTVARAASENVTILNTHTSGGRVRFLTDSARIAIRVRWSALWHMPHMPLTGSSGFDLYREGEYCHSFIPPANSQTGYSGTYTEEKTGLHAYEINFPLYNPVAALEIGLEPGCTLQTPSAYDRPPVIFYGHSITQGGCASRPGTCHVNMLARWLRCDIRNLGFSGSARGEMAVAEYIAKQEMSIFVMDYADNAPDADFLRETHYPFLMKVRQAQPDLPILLLSASQIRFSPRGHGAKRDVVRESYEKRLAAGDRHIHFLDGETLYAGEDWFECTVDRAHPNDLGFYRMAQTLKPILQRLMNGDEKNI